ncbi:MAG: hypothetical protein ACM3JD_00155, partial [Rudaea sp.]
ASTQSRKAQLEFNRAMYTFYQKHYARVTPLWLNALVVAGIAARGGLTLAREIMAPRAALK